MSISMRFVSIEAGEQAAFDELFGGGRDAYDAQRAAVMQERPPAKRRKRQPDVMESARACSC